MANLTIGCVQELVAWVEGGMAENRSERPDGELKRLSSSELDEIVRRHEQLSAGIPGGRRALLSFHDLTGADLSGRDLAESDFTGSAARNQLATSRIVRLRFANGESCGLRPLSG
jgi:uncharacterized protein YjbI with pentapeptide repeats